VEPCSTVALFIKVNSAVNFNPLALFTWIVFFFENQCSELISLALFTFTWTLIFFCFF
jgi:hypothetical protein